MLLHTHGTRLDSQQVAAHHRRQLPALIRIGPRWSIHAPEVGPEFLDGLLKALDLGIVGFDGGEYPVQLATFLKYY